MGIYDPKLWASWRQHIDDMIHRSYGVEIKENEDGSRTITLPKLGSPDQLPLITESNPIVTPVVIHKPIELQTFDEALNFKGKVQYV